jgi:FG-GAP repeat
MAATTTVPSMAPVSVTLSVADTTVSTPTPSFSLLETPSPTMASLATSLPSGPTASFLLDSAALDLATLTPTPKIPSWNDSSLVVAAQLTGPQIVEDGFGTSVALSSNGQVLAVGAPWSTNGIGMVQAGQVYIYHATKNETLYNITTSSTRQTATEGTVTTVWQRRGLAVEGQQAYALAGYQVSLNKDGTILAVSHINATNGTGQVCVYQYNQETENYDTLRGQVLVSNETTGTSVNFGSVLVLSDSGQYVAMGEPHHSRDSGRVVVYRYNVDTEQWTMLGKPMDGVATKSDNDNGMFGSALDLVETTDSDDGAVVFMAVSAPYHVETNGYVMVYEWNEPDQKWKQVGGLLTNRALWARTRDGYYGASLSLISTGSTLRLAVGAPLGGSETDADQGVGRIDVYQLDMRHMEWILLDGPTASFNDDQSMPHRPVHTGYTVQLWHDVLVEGAPGGNSNSSSSTGGDTMGSVRLYRYQEDQNGGGSYQTLTDNDMPLVGWTANEGFGSALAVASHTDGRLVLAVGGTASRLLRPQHGDDTASSTEPAVGYVTLLEQVLQG